MQLIAVSTNRRRPILQLHCYAHHLRQRDLLLIIAIITHLPIYRWCFPCNLA